MSLAYVGAGTLGDPGAVTGGGEKSKRARKKFGRRKVKNDEFLSRPFRLFPALTNCPWVPQDVIMAALSATLGSLRTFSPAVFPMLVAISTQL